MHNLPDEIEAILKAAVEAARAAGSFLRPRPECFWPVDAMILAERLLGGKSL